ncbi:MAG: ketoacyl-ACP synthase III [Butyrivibrio sp.]|nr:ketoacyl-ACP synthase III [Acetatifactor muris]MCM1558617.1 ketoacyl-ACP synthase III [Butyrivibrio sp.]
MSIKIIGTGSALPEKTVTNEDLAQMVETSDRWIRERTGIGSRHISAGETVTELSASACKRALADAGCTPEEVDLLLVATCSPETGVPCVACQVQGLIGASRAAALDLNAACSGFLFALHTAWAYMEAGIYKKALIVGAEVLSKLVDWTDRGTCILFGDGAGAVLAEYSGQQDAFYFVQHSDGSRGGALRCDARQLKNPYVEAKLQTPWIQMDGREIFAFAVRQVPECIEEALARAQMTAGDVDLFVLHQANLRIIESIAKRLKQDMAKFPVNLDRVGNMSSAAIPVLLDELKKDGRLKAGMNVVLSGFGAGLTWGACVMKW